MSPSALKALLNHDGRLDVLCCLIDGEPLTVAQLSARTGKSLTAVDLYVKLLDSFDLIGQAGELSGGEALYAATLDKHPDWVRNAIEEHRRG